METVTLTVLEIKKIAGKNRAFLGAMKQLAPHLFPNTNKPTYFDLPKLVVSKGHGLFNGVASREAGFDNSNFIQICEAGKHAGVGFSLDPAYCWKIVKDPFGNKILVPTRKKKKDEK